MSEVKKTFIVAKKELRDHSRDLRSVLSALLFPLLGPVALALMFQVITSWTTKDKSQEVAMVGKVYAPALVAFFERQGLPVKDAPADYEEQVKLGKLDVAVVVDSTYGAAFAEGEPAPITVVFDSSRTKAQTRSMRVRRLLDAYGRQVGHLRLIARGVTPDIATPLAVNELDLATPEKMAATILASIPMFLVFAAFAGGMYVAIDTTAGERERGSFEPLLLCPVSRGALVTGKWLATVAAALLALLVSIAAFAITVRAVPLESLGIKPHFGPVQAGQMLAAAFPLTLLASALQMFLSTLAKSFKEAQTYLQLFMMLPFIPAMYIALAPIETQLWMMSIPILGQDLLLVDVLRGEPLGVSPFLLAAAVCTLLTAVCLYATARLFESEKIIFAR
ncbi:MAG: ABC transporter permease [Polyangiaceae bacterium]|nr:ABC transporter permease [Polyangiaceae bacterium]